MNMNLGMKLRNIHTGIEAEIVGKTILASAVVRGSRLRKTVYVLEYGDTHLTGKRHFQRELERFLYAQLGMYEGAKWN